MEFLKKYGVWIAIALVLVYVMYVHFRAEKAIGVTPSAPMTATQILSNFQKMQSAGDLSGLTDNQQNALADYMNYLKSNPNDTFDQVHAWVNKTLVPKYGQDMAFINQN